MSVLQLSFSSNPTTRSTILLIDDDPFEASARKSVLEQHFTPVQSISGAADAFIRMEDPSFVEELALIVVALRMPGLSGPAFVKELANRAPDVPILVIGRYGESAPEYSAGNVRFLPQTTSTKELLSGARAILSRRMARVA